MISLRYNKNKNFIYLFIFILLFLICTYIPSIRNVFAFSDDYKSLMDIKSHEFYKLIEMTSRDGRPLYGLFQGIFFLTPRLEDLKWVRLLSLCLIAAFCSLVVITCRKKSDFPPAVCFLFACWLALMPAFQLYAVWTVTFIYPLAAILSALSFLLLDQQESSTSGRVAMSFGLLLTAMMLYQPCAMIFFLFAAICWLTKPDSLPSYRQIALAGGVMIVAIGIDGMIAKIVPYIFFPPSSASGRVQIGLHFSEKLKWFVNTLMPWSCMFASIRSKDIQATFVETTILYGLCLNMVRYGQQNAKRIFLFLILPPLSMLPNLIVQDSWSCRRIMATLPAIMALYLTISLVTWSKVLKLTWIAPTTLSIIVLFSAATARRNITRDFISIQTHEITAISSYLGTLPGLCHAHNIYIVPANIEDSTGPALFADEFGRLSSNTPWAPPGMIGLIMTPSCPAIIPALAAATVGPEKNAPTESFVVNLHTALVRCKTVINGTCI
ncbi:hypothetical protein ACU81Q_01155 [Komagataeibacter melomenusus]